MRVSQLAPRLGMSVNTIWRLSRQGKFPKPKKLSDKITVWDGGEVAAWLASKGGCIMPRPYSIIDTLPEDIKKGLFSMILERKHYCDISQWLNEAHGVQYSKSALQRLGKPTQDKYAPLIAFGMPIGVIVQNRLTIEALGVAQVAQSLLDKLAENPAGLFAYLDQQGGGQ